MCLTIWRSELPRNFFEKLLGIRPKIKPRVAKNDISCYKVYKLTDIPGVVEAPYRHTKHLVGKPQPKVLLTYNTGWHEDDDTQRNVYVGYHSYMSEKADPFFKNKSNYIIKECIIPKGSIYYIGNTLGIRDSYVSDQLIIL